MSDNARTSTWVLGGSFCEGRHREVGRRVKLQDSTGSSLGKAWGLYRQVKLGLSGVRWGITRRDRCRKGEWARTHQLETRAALTDLAAGALEETKSRPLGGAGRDAPCSRQAGGWNQCCDRSL